MPRIAIPKVRDDRKPVEYRVRLNPQLNDQLQLYGKLYAETYSQQIEAKDLLEPIIRRFLESDRGFKTFKRRQRLARDRSDPTTNTSTGRGPNDPIAKKS